MHMCGIMWCVISVAHTTYASWRDVYTSVAALTFLMRVRARKSAPLGGANARDLHVYISGYLALTFTHLAFASSRAPWHNP